MIKNIKPLSKPFRGSIMLEVLVVIGLVFLISPLIYIRAIKYSEELEDAAIAQNLRNLQQGVYTYIERNYNKIIDGTLEISESEIGAMDDSETVDYHIINTADTDFRRFVKIDNYTSSNLFDNIKIAIKREKISAEEVDENTDESETLTETTMVSALIVTDSSDNEAIDDVRGSRIATLIGSNAGYSQGDGQNMEASGAGGFFNVNVYEFFSTDMPSSGQLVVATDSFYFNNSVINQVSGDFLFRQKATSNSSYDETKAHRMETNIDFGIYDSVESPDVATSGRDIEDVGRIYGGEYQGNKTDDLIADYGYSASGVDETVVTYGVNFNNNTAFIEDARIASLGGAKISEVIPELILMAIYQDISYGNYVPKPGYDNPRILRNNSGCPTGYSERYELVQKEAIAGVDMLALAEHSTTTGIHSVKSWLRNNALRRSQHTDGSTIYYRTYNTGAGINTECRTDSTHSFVCTTLEYVNNVPKIYQQCTPNMTVYYDVNDADNVVDVTNISSFPYSNISVSALYSTSLGSFVYSYNDMSSISSATSLGSSGTAFLSCPAGGTCTCSNKYYCPDYWDNEKSSIDTLVDSNTVTDEFIQHGTCQAAINMISDSVDFLPYGDDYIAVNADGTFTEAQTVTATTAEVNSSSSGATEYYNTRLYFKTADVDEADLDCGSGSNINNISGLCQYDTKRYSTLPVNYDLYFYCERNQPTE